MRRDRPAIFMGAGLIVELDTSGCIDLVAPLNSGPDVRVTVVDVDGLCDALHQAQLYRDIDEAGEHHEQWRQREEQG